MKADLSPFLFFFNPNERHLLDNVTSRLRNDGVSLCHTLTNPPLPTSPPLISPPKLHFTYFLLLHHLLLFSQVNKQQLQAVKERFLAFLNGETQIVADEAFCNAVRSYYEARAFHLYLTKSDVFQFYKSQGSNLESV